MIFLSLIVVLILVQWWGSGAPFQHDGWFFRWLNVLQSWRGVNSISALHLVLAVFVPVAIIGCIVWAIVQVLSPTWLLFVNVPVLLYSLGRGNFSVEVNDYLVASERGDNVLASKLIDDLRGSTGIEKPNDEVDNWYGLHSQALQVISYRSFERMFAVLFWFCLLGAVGALAYRLSVIYRECASPLGRGDKVAAKWLWLMEWPAVRAMGLTWALVGNFDTCFRCWQSRLLDTRSASIVLLNNSLRGALGVEVLIDEDQCGATAGELPALMPNEPAYSLSLVRASLPLFSRALLLWVCVIALVTLSV